MITLKDFFTDSDVTIVSILILFSGIYIVRSDHIRFGTWYYLLSGQYDFFLCNLKKIFRKYSRLPFRWGYDFVPFSGGAGPSLLYLSCSRGWWFLFFQYNTREYKEECAVSSLDQPVSKIEYVQTFIFSRTDITAWH